MHRSPSYYRRQKARKNNQVLALVKDAKANIPKPRPLIDTSAMCFAEILWQV
jgi:hypothetical protein